MYLRRKEGHSYPAQGRQTKHFNLSIRLLDWGSRVYRTNNTNKMDVGSGILYDALLCTCGSTTDGNNRAIASNSRENSPPSTPLSPDLASSQLRMHPGMTSTFLRYRTSANLVSSAISGRLQTQGKALSVKNVDFLRSSSHHQPSWEKDIQMSKSRSRDLTYPWTANANLNLATFRV